jgi:ketosteroid isomerase-like protein
MTGLLASLTTALLVITAVSPANQVAPGAIAGEALDPAGGVIPGATVTTIVDGLVAPRNTGSNPRVAPGAQAPRDEVFAAERAFAATMARRDVAAFASFIDDEAVFFGDAGPLRGKAAIVKAWSRFFTERDAPFSWEPDQVEVLPSGTLAHSSGPVRSPAGVVVSRFNSIWRRDAAGVWQIIFDKGSPLPAAPGTP